MFKKVGVIMNCNNEIKKCEEKSALLGPLDKNENDWTSEEFDEIKEFF